MFLRIDFQIKKSRKNFIGKDGFQSRGWLERPSDRQRRILDDLHFKRSARQEQEQEENPGKNSKGKEKVINVNFLYLIKFSQHFLIFVIFESFFFLIISVKTDKSSLIIFLFF